MKLLASVADGLTPKQLDPRMAPRWQLQMAPWPTLDPHRNKRQGMYHGRMQNSGALLRREELQVEPHRRNCCILKSSQLRRREHIRDPSRQGTAARHQTRGSWSAY